MAYSLSRLLDHIGWDSSGRVISRTQRPLPKNAQHSQETSSMQQPGLEPAFPASERPKIFAIDARILWDSLKYLKYFKEVITVACSMNLLWRDWKNKIKLDQNIWYPVLDSKLGPSEHEGKLFLTSFKNDYWTATTYTPSTGIITVSVAVNLTLFFRASYCNVLMNN